MTQQSGGIPDTYVFRGEGVHITYTLSEDMSPYLEYEEGGQKLAFNDPQVRRQQSELGDLISVTLKPSVDAGATVLTLILPPLNMAGQQEQHFETLAITTESYGILPHDGARLTYHARKLYGIAKFTQLPGE